MDNAMKRVVGLAVAALIAPSLLGCGGGGPALVPVSGTVTLNGKPLEGASVVFTPDASTKDAYVARDVTGPSGNYKAITNGRSGVAPGKYKVSIMKSRIDVSKAPEEFKDDPYMAKLSLGPDDSPRKSRAKNSAASDEIKGEFDCEISAATPVQDFDVKSSAKDF